MQRQTSHQNPRTVSLLPSATEIVFALGKGGCLVGRSHECDYPEQATKLPVCTEAKLPPGRSSSEREAEELVARCQERMEEVAARTSSGRTRPTVATLEWLDPPMAGGNWMPELVEMAGGVNLFGIAGEHSPWLDWDALLEADPEVIVVVPCGFDITRTMDEMPALTTRPGWHDLSAVANGRVFIMDGNAYFNRPGPRIVDSLEILATALHPELFVSTSSAEMSCPWYGVGYVKYVFSSAES